MGNILSGDEKLSHLFSSYDKRSRGIVWIDDHFGYRPANKNQRKAFNLRRTLYYDGNKESVVRQRSHSLGAIIGDLYAYEEDLGGSYQDLNRETYFKYSRSFLPRIKLVKNMPIKEDFHCTSNQDLYNCSDGRHSVSDNPTTSYKDEILLLEKEERRLPRTPSYHENEINCDIIDKPEENYFTKNFDECMKRLQIIEKEQEIMEKDGDRNLNAHKFKKPGKRQLTPTVDHVPPPPLEMQNSSLIEDNYKKKLEEIPEKDSMTKDEEVDYFQEIHNEEKSNDIETAKDEKSSSSGPTHGDQTKGWYSNLKKQFEPENVESKTKEAKEASCRVMGATLKSSTLSMPASNGEGKEVRHYFSRLVRSNKSLIDEELPDPDKVQNIRAMFQESLNSTLGKGFNKRFGGSLQNISWKPKEDQFARPKSAQGNRNDFAAEFGKIKKENCKITSKNTAIYESGESTLNPSSKVISMGKFKSTDTGTGKFFNRKYLWTDTASLSSGVSSDLSSCDTDGEFCSRDIEQNTTDEEFQDIEDKHYVQSETLEKIRSFGTSVTYFGGQMITCSVGPLLSPTTQAILEEIGEKYQDRNNFTRTFEEFYKKYTENNEPRFKKIGRTRSFGQSDVFYKPNILHNTEIDMYKNDLEMEIGIRKPTGKVQGILKQKLVKSNSVGSRFEFFERDVVDKLNEILEAAVEMTNTPGKTENNCVTEMEDGVESQKEKEKIVEENRNEEKENEELRKLNEHSEEEREETVTRDTRSSQLLFGYEKNIFDRERKSDMDFEEFEVCETIEDKMDKIDENPQNYRLTIHVNQEVPEEKETLEEIIINDQEPLDSLEIYLKSRKTEENSTAHQANYPCLNMGKSLENSSTPSESLNKCCHIKSEITSSGDILDKSYFMTRMYASSKWPIETSVMVDIQKNEENSPKLITPAKSPVKTKTRTFKK